MTKSIFVTRKMGWATRSVRLNKNYMTSVTPNTGFFSLLESSFFLDVKEQEQGTQEAMD